MELKMNRIANNAHKKFDNDELIESYLNGNMDYIRKSWKDMNYIDKDDFIVDIRSSYITDFNKIQLLSILLKSTF